MTKWEPDILLLEAARLDQIRAAAQVEDLYLTIVETRRIIAESRKLLQRLADKAGATQP
jgi:hypothetical protein